MFFKLVELEEKKLKILDIDIAQLEAKNKKSDEDIAFAEKLMSSIKAIQNGSK